MSCRLCGGPTVVAAEREDLTLHRCAACAFISGDPHQRPTTTDRYRHYYRMEGREPGHLGYLSLDVSTWRESAAKRRDGVASFDPHASARLRDTGLGPLVGHPLARNIESWAGGSSVTIIRCHARVLADAGEPAA